MNAFFQIDRKSDGTYLICFPSDAGGTSINIKELNEYLERLNIIFDKGLLLKECVKLTEKIEIKLCEQLIAPVHEMLVVEVDMDKTKAVGRFYPPSNEGALMSRQEIMNELLRSNVRYGMSEDTITSFFQKRCYCTDYTLAKALQPVQGTSASITYHFNTLLSNKPKTYEDGSVDFHQLDNMSLVEKGTLLATLTPAVYGKPGIDVYGNIISPLKVVNKTLKYGRDIYLSDDGCYMYSNIEGHVMLVDQKVFVEGCYEIPADVDASTGDINFTGNVTIKGSVRTGYQVQAKGDIIVEGVVEGAVLIAGGQIILKHGIQGMMKGVLNAKGNVISKFIENAVVNCEGYVATDSILHSKITAKGDIIVSGKKGFITGGEIRSATLISVKTAGSSMGTNTLLEVGTDPALLDEQRNIEKRIPELEAEIEKITQIQMLFAKKIKNGEKFSSDKIAYVRTLSAAKESHQEKLEELDNRLIEILNFMQESPSGNVKVNSMIYPGCKIIISGISYFIRSELSHCRFYKDGSDIKMGPL